MRILLTDAAIKRLKPESTQLKVWDTKVPGLCLVIGKRTKTFYAVHGQARTMTKIGRYSDIDLKQARKEAKVLTATNPQKNAQSAVSDLTEAYLEDIKPNVRPKTHTSYKLHLSKAPDLTVDKMNMEHINGNSPHEVMAWRIFYNWLIRHQYYHKNPFAFVPIRYNQRQRILFVDEIKRLWAYDAKPYSTILKLLLLTGQRRSQIWNLQQEWVEGDTITFPSDIMKGKEAHTIPYGPLTKELISEAPFSFNGWSKAKTRCDKVTEIHNWRVHDLRRTFATTHASLGTTVHIVERLLAHTSGTISGVTAIYNRYDYLKEATEAVATYEKYIQTITA